MSDFAAPPLLIPSVHAPSVPIAPPPAPAPLHVAVPCLADENLDVRYMNGRNWRLLESFSFASQVLERIITVPKDFITDFASIPRLFQNILSPTGPYGKAALVHDDLYRTPGICTRAQADRTFLEAMVALKVSWWTRMIMYGGVRLGGHGSYKGGL